MKKELNKLEKFIQALELKGLNENEEAVILTSNYGGMSSFVSWIPCDPECSTSNNRCINGTSGCRNSSNQDCTNRNSNCVGAINSGNCSNL